MKAYKIDSANKTVTEITVSENASERLAQLQKHCGGIITVAFELANLDCCFVDDEGMLKGYIFYFEYKGITHQAFAGNGVILGTDEEGDSVDAKTNIEEIRKNIKFLGAKQVMEKYGSEEEECDHGDIEQGYCLDCHKEIFTYDMEHDSKDMER